MAVIACACRPPGNDGNYGIFIEYPEIIPVIRKENFSLCIGKDGKEAKLFEKPAHTLRALFESKIMSLKVNLEIFGLKDIKRVVVTGGGSKNQQILQIIADVFEVEVYVAGEGFVEDSAAFGSCLRACHGYFCALANGFIHFSELFKDKKIGNFKLAASPRKEYQPVYAELLKNYQALEKKLEEK